ncbi:MAG: SDR family oxidoreductase [Sphingomonas sp.]
MTEFDRRQLLTGTAAIVATAGLPAAAQTAAAQPAATPSLAGKSILITGTSTGFGHIGALLYARAGAKVIASMRNLPRPEAETLRRAAREERLDLHVIEIDVTNDAQVARGVAEAERIAGGALDVLVNNAGLPYSGPVELQDIAATQAMFDTNLIGYQRMARAVLPAMRSRRAGLIVNVSSQLGRMVVPFGGMYCATKYAVEGWAEQMAYELAPRGVEVTIIQPGGYPTNIWPNRIRLTRQLLDRTPDALEAAYPEFRLRDPASGGGGSTDPADVPRAIAEIIAMPAGSRPLRRAVHPGPRPHEAINDVSARVQRLVLGRGPYAPWMEAVLG